MCQTNYPTTAGWFSDETLYQDRQGQFHLHVVREGHGEKFSKLARREADCWCVHRLIPQTLRPMFYVPKK